MCLTKGEFTASKFMVHSEYEALDRNAEPLGVVVDLVEVTFVGHRSSDAVSEHSINDWAQ